MINSDTIRTMLIVGVISGFIGGAFGLSIAKLTGVDSTEMHAQASGQKIIVLSPADFMKSQGAMNSDSVKNAFAAMKETANQLALEGYIVLSAKAVMKAPDSVIYNPNGTDLSNGAE